MIYKLGEKTPKIGENNYIAENATVIGEVVTNENVSIWFGAVVRADMSKVTVEEILIFKIIVQFMEILHIQ
mgnify:FL=1